MIIAFAGALSHAAVIPTSSKSAASEGEQGQARTLGLVTAGANVVGSGIGTIGRLAAVAVGLVAAVKPLIILGLGKCKYKKVIVLLLICLTKFVIIIHSLPNSILYLETYQFLINGCLFQTRFTDG